ncbi:carbohydrate ABC transporter permease [Paramicrobacterium agarici]|uniref:Carbohydrate ABC transporter membrane protein 1 (CUT1 family) n=1 Tax=Paramicrobacterium agarici TaxID=630514 RepID=A0A2A9DXP0_9MICO|nr:sugar ABC transporter permease [Microbacterium agarici]PFG30689.1 carbohydrate ABC transporter membrane protein 1 (CUT1 family) [Microbacterium agarici]
MSIEARPAAGSLPPSQPGQGKRTKTRLRRRIDLLPYALITPLIVFIIVLALVPAGMTLVQSFYKAQPLNPPNSFVGLGNFFRLFADDTVVSSMVNTGWYVLIGVVLSTVLGIFMAVTLQKPFRGRSILIAVLILPWALPGVVEGIVWSGIWDSNTGLLNSVLTSLHLIDTYQVFLGQNQFVTILLIEIVQVWQMTPLSTLLILAALQNIPGELYEAAALDGATGWEAFLRVTLPLARPGIAVAMVQAVIATLNVFDQPFVLNGAAATGASVTQQIYFVSFQNLDFGQGYALSLLVTIVTVAISLVIVRLVYRTVEF